MRRGDAIGPECDAAAFEAIDREAWSPDLDATLLYVDPDPRLAGRMTVTGSRSSSKAAHSSCVRCAKGIGLGLDVRPDCSL